MDHHQGSAWFCWRPVPMHENANARLRLEMALLEREPGKIETPPGEIPEYRQQMGIAEKRAKRLQPPIIASR
jgi:hypothetical protein